MRRVQAIAQGFGVLGLGYGLALALGSMWRLFAWTAGI